MAYINRYIIHEQDSTYSSPWSLGCRFKMLLWDIIWAALCSWTPKPLNSWRVFWLRVFGAKISGHPFVHQHTRIQIPWNLTLHDHACLGDETWVYSLGDVEIMKDATVAQQAYLCTGTHDFDDPKRPLCTGKITVGESAFLGARVFVLPGISIGAGAVIGACSVVTHDISAGAVAYGNPAIEVPRVRRGVAPEGDSGSENTAR